MRSNQPRRGGISAPTAQRPRRTTERVAARRAIYTAASATLAALLMPSAAHAVDTFWDGTTGDWNTATNWSTDAVPGPSDNAMVNNGGTAQITSDAPAVIDIRAGDGAASTGTINHTAGAIRVNEWMRIGIGGGTGTYSLSGTGNLTVQNALNIGEGGTGTLNVSGGTLTKLTPTLPTDNDGDQWFNVGFGQNGNGTFNLSGGTVQVNGPQNVFLVARGGASGTVNQTGGTLNVDGDTNIGDASDVGDVGTYNITGGTFTSDVITVGAWDNATGNFNVSPGATVNAERFLSIGRPGVVGVSRGTLTQTGGDITAGGIRLGTFGANEGGAEGVYNMSGGTLRQPDVADLNNQEAWNYIGHAGTSTTGMARSGTFNLSNGTVSLDSRTMLGNAPGSNGTVNQTGGSLEVRRHEVIIGDVGTGTYNISGGTLRTLAGGGSQDIIVGHWDSGVGTLAVSANGTVETARHLIVGNGNPENLGALPTAGVVNQTGGTVRVNGDIQIANQSDATGTYNLSGGILDMTGGNINFGNGTGAFNMTGGELRNLGSTNRSFSATGGVFRPGSADDPIGISTINGDFTLGPASTLLLDLAVADDGSSDVVDVNGTANLSGLLALDTPSAALITPGTQYTIVTPDNRTGQFSNPTLVADNNQIFTISYTGGDGNDIVITATNQVIPEPGVASLLGLAAGAGLLRRRSRRR